MTMVYYDGPISSLGTNSIIIINSIDPKIHHQTTKAGNQQVHKVGNHNNIIIDDSRDMHARLAMGKNHDSNRRFF